MAAPATGHGATITFGTTLLTGCFTTIGGHERTIPALDTSCLDTVGSRTKIPGDLVDESGMDIEMFFDPTEELPIMGAIEEVVVTYPLMTPTGFVPATFTGDAFITSDTLPSLVTDELMVQTVHIEWAEGPLFVAEVATTP